MTGKAKPAAKRVRCALVGAALATGAAMAGCSADDPLNASFPLRMDAARLAIAAMQEDPRPAARPIVVAMGWLDPGFAGLQVGRRLDSVLARRADGRPVFRSLSFVGCPTFDACRRRLVECVEETWPSDDPAWTIEVDVIGVSMGGLVARYAATAGDDGCKQLRMRQLFTISTPHRGAAMAGIPTLDARVIDMRPGSEFLEELDGAWQGAGYEIVPYVRLGDAMVGAERAAAPGRDAWWVPRPPLQPSHLTTAADPRILADICCRLRGEKPWTSDPPAPLPLAGSLP